MTNKFELLITGQQFKKLYEKCYENIMETYELKKIDMDVLLFLSHAGEFNTSKDIANLLYVSKAHVSKSIEHLHIKGLITLLCDTSDRRYVHIHLSEQGTALLKEIYDIKDKLDEILFEGITDKEKQTFLELCKKITANMEHSIENTM